MFKIYSNKNGSDLIRIQITAGLVEMTCLILMPTKSPSNLFTVADGVKNFGVSIFKPFFS